VKDALISQLELRAELAVLLERRAPHGALPRRQMVAPFRIASFAPSHQPRQRQRRADAAADLHGRAPDLVERQLALQGFVGVAHAADLRLEPAYRLLQLTDIAFEGRYLLL